MLAVRVRGKGETYLVHGGDALTEERIFPSSLESDVVEQIRSNREEHARSTVLFEEKGEEATKEKRLTGVVMEASSHSSQQSRPDKLQEVMMFIMKGILDSSQCSVVAFKGNIRLDSSMGSPVGRLGVVGHHAVQGILRAGRGKSSGNRQGKKLNKIIRDKGSPFKASSPRVPLAEPVSSILELLQSQFQ